MSRTAAAENYEEAKRTLATKKRGTVSYVLLSKVCDKLKTGLTLNEICHEVGVNQPILYRWIKGIRENINSQTVDALAEYFDLKLQ